MSPSNDTTVVSETSSQPTTPSTITTGTTTTPPPTISILLYGLGAIGSFYAFILQRAPTTQSLRSPPHPQVQLSVIARSNYTAVKSNGIIIKSDNHGEHHFHPYAVYRTTEEARRDRDEKGLGAFEFVVVASKAVDLGWTVDELSCVVDGGGDGDPNGKGSEGGRSSTGVGDGRAAKTTIVVMQNGVGNEDFFHLVFPQCTILSGVIWVGATQDSPGIVRQHINESTTIGIYDNHIIPLTSQQASLNQFTALLSAGGTPYIISPTIQTPRWKKCIWNAAWNSLTTLSGVDTHRWLDSSSFAIETTRRLMLEAVRVAQAMGIPGIEEGLADELIGTMQGLPGPVWTSMYHDSRAGRGMEVDVILGAIVRFAREVEVAVPTLETLYALMLAVQGRVDRGEVLV